MPDMISDMFHVQGRLRILFITPWGENQQPVQYSVYNYYQDVISSDAQACTLVGASNQHVHNDCPSCASADISSTTRVQWDHRGARYLYIRWFNFAAGLGDETRSTSSELYLSHCLMFPKLKLSTHLDVVNMERQENIRILRQLFLLGVLLELHSFMSWKRKRSRLLLAAMCQR